jgi:hypothetical protein
MPLRLTLLAISACATALVVAPGRAQAAPEITLTRLDCGTPRGAVADLGFSFSDTFGDSVPNIRLVFSCYLIKHGNDYMLWDTGWGMSAAPVARKTSLIDLLTHVNVKPEQIKYVGQSLSRRPRRPGELVSQGDAPDRQGRLGRLDWPEAPTINSSPTRRHS